VVIRWVRIKVLKELGLTSDKPLKIGDTKVSPKEFLSRCAPPPDVRVKDAASISVEILGEKDGEKTRLVYQLVKGFHEKYRVSALAYLTGVPLSIACQMLEKEKSRKKGYYPAKELWTYTRS